MGMSLRMVVTSWTKPAWWTPPKLTRVKIQMKAIAVKQAMIGFAKGA